MEPLPPIYYPSKQFTYKLGSQVVRVQVNELENCGAVTNHTLDTVCIYYIDLNPFPRTAVVQSLLSNHNRQCSLSSSSQHVEVVCMGLQRERHSIYKWMLVSPSPEQTHNHKEWTERCLSALT